MGFIDFDGDLCGDAANYYYAYGIKIIESMHILMSISSIFISCLFYYHCNQYFYFHKNCKILILLILGINIFHGISISTTQIYHLVRFFIAVQPCDVLINNVICYALRFPAHMSMTMYVYVQAAVALERTIAVCSSKRYEKYGAHLGYLLAVVVVALSLPPSYLFLAKWDLAQSTPYCSNVNFYTYQDMFVFICYYNTVVVLISLLVFILTRFYNRSQMRRRHLDVSHRYQLQENENVFKIFCPEVWFHFIFYVFYGASNMLSFQIHDLVNSRQEFRTFLAAINTIPYYTLLSPLFMWWRLKKARIERKSAVVEIATKKHADVMSTYFGSLEAQWESEAARKNTAK